MNYDFDVCIIGGGIAGIMAARTASENNLSVVLFEKNKMGGISLNNGDVFFSKAFDIFKNKAHLRNYIEIDESQEQEISFKTFKNLLTLSRNDFVDQCILDFKGNENIKIINKECFIVNKNQVSCDGKIYTCDKLILAYGQRQKMLDLPGFGEALKRKFLIFSTHIMYIKNDAKKIAIIGSGRIAFEIAMFLNELGLEVYMLARHGFLNHLDNEVKVEYLKLIKNPLLHLIDNVNYQLIEDKRIYYKTNDKTEFLEVDNVIMSIGFENRNIDFGELDLELVDQGIVVDQYGRTKTKNVYAIGDCNYNPNFSTLAYIEAQVAVNHILGIKNKKSNLFIQRILGKYEYAYVGENEEELNVRNIPYVVKKIQKQDIIDNKKFEFIKVIVHKYTRKLLGLFVIGENAQNIINAAIYSFNTNLNDEINNLVPYFTEDHQISLDIKDFLKQRDNTVINEHFFSYYQAKVDKNKMIIGAESLARFKFDNQFINPLIFINNFEENAMIYNLDLKVIENACLLLNKLQHLNLLKEGFTISCNLSPITINLISLRRISAIIEKYNIDPKYLILEITERVNEDSIDFVAKIETLREIGFKVSMDDFSVGNSSLTLYNKIDFNEVKIDMSLLPNDDNDLVGKAIYTNLINVLRFKKVSIVSEGVETDFHFAFLQTLKIDSYQGYLFYKPLDEENFIKLLQK